MQVFPEKKCSRIGREAREFSAFSKTGKSGENLRKKRAGDKNPRPLKTGRGIEISGDEKIKFSPRGKKKKRKNHSSMRTRRKRRKNHRPLSGGSSGKSRRLSPARPGSTFSVSWRWRASCPAAVSMVSCASCNFFCVFSKTSVNFPEFVLENGENLQSSCERPALHGQP